MTSSRVLPAHDLARVAVFAALIAVLGLPGQLLLAGNSVPITFQTLGVMLAGSLLGARLAGLTVATFLLLVAAGLPLLAGGRGGLSVFTLPSAGYIVGFFGAVVIGWIVERGGTAYRPWLGLVANVVGGIVVVYACGVVGLMIVSELPFWVAVTGNGVFLPGDLIKAVVATAVATGVHRAYPMRSTRTARASGR